ncbi:hypothetical protein B0H16DRAFT_1472993 [Mycena metata]|uniref:Uncharacterized protein n=1 Tax=Mycena metata TaxID=1033252 RepID=A0AAD7MMN1_9AGAR|nr:hypothetical protein B0H16DRAFT_1472993 [Mycena metata]
MRWIEEKKLCERQRRVNKLVEGGIDKGEKYVGKEGGRGEETRRKRREGENKRIRIRGGEVVKATPAPAPVKLVSFPSNQRAAACTAPAPCDPYKPRATASAGSTKWMGSRCGGVKEMERKDGENNEISIASRKGGENAEGEGKGREHEKGGERIEDDAGGREGGWMECRYM